MRQKYRDVEKGNSCYYTESIKCAYFVTVCNYIKVLTVLGDVQARRIGTSRFI